MLILAALLVGLTLGYLGCRWSLRPRPKAATYVIHDVRHTIYCGEDPTAARHAYEQGGPGTHFVQNGETRSVKP